MLLKLPREAAHKALDRALDRMEAVDLDLEASDIETPIEWKNEILKVTVNAFGGWGYSTSVQDEDYDPLNIPGTPCRCGCGGVTPFRREKV